MQTLTLSQGRARAVADYLISKGIKQLVGFSVLRNEAGQ